MYTWLHLQRQQEEAFFNNIKTYADAGLTEAKEQTGTQGTPDLTYVLDADSENNHALYGWPSTWVTFGDITNETNAAMANGLSTNLIAAGASGAAKLLVDATANRDSDTADGAATTGSAFRMPHTRAQQVDLLSVTVDTGGATRYYVTDWTTPD
jgi:predicted nucleotidyltransferase